MKILLGLLVAWGALAVAQARPLVVQESARIANPDPAHYPYFASDVAIDGDDAIATLERYIERRKAATRETSSTTSRSTCSVAPPAAGRRCGNSSLHHHGVVRQLSSPGSRCAMASRRSRSIRCTSSSGAMATGCPRPSPASIRAMPGDSITIDGTRILFGGSSGQWHGHALREEHARRAIWGPTSIMLGDYRGGDDEFTGGPVDISGGRAVVLSPYNEEEFPLASPGVTVYREWGPPRALPAPVRHSQLRRRAARLRGRDPRRRDIHRRHQLAPARASTARRRAMPGKNSTSCSRSTATWAAASPPSSRRTTCSSCSATGTRSARPTSSTCFARTPANPTNTWPRWSRATADRSATSASAAGA